MGVIKGYLQIVGGIDVDDVILENCTITFLLSVFNERSASAQ